MRFSFATEAKSVVMPIAIVGITLLIIFTTFADAGEVLAAMGAIDLGVLGIVLVLSLVNYVLRFWRWTLFLGAQAAAVPPGRHFTIYMAGFALTATPGKIGEAIRSFYLRPFGVSAGRSLAALYAERLFDMIVISALAMLIFASAGGAVRWLGFLGAAIAAALIGSLHPAAVRLLEALAARLPGRRIPSAIEAVSGFLRHVRSMMTPRLLAMGLVTGVVAWGAEGAGTYLVARALGMGPELLLAVGIYAAAMLAGALSFLPGGLGSTEVVMISLLISTGAPAPAAVAATMIVRLATLWFAVALGIGAWAGLELFRGTAPGPLRHLSEKE